MDKQQQQPKLEWYQQEIKRTMPDLGSLQLNLSHMVLGIGSETEEMVKAMVTNDSVGIQEEIIDQFWYIGNYCTLRNYNLNQLFEDRGSFLQEPWEEQADVFLVQFSKLQDYIKKFIAYGKEIDVALEQNALKAILNSLDQFLLMFDLDLEQGLQNNIDKLRIRFPDKFDAENALNRNLDAERKELEK